MEDGFADFIGKSDAEIENETQKVENRVINKYEQKVINELRQNGFNEGRREQYSGEDVYTQGVTSTAEERLW
jgi:flagellar biosynthesis/type III secretory pathway protein FliH